MADSALGGPRLSTVVNPQQVLQGDAPDRAILKQIAQQHVMRRRFSQNMLIDPDVLARIAQTVDPHAGELLVEIGPGLGFLSEALLRLPSPAPLVAIDVDRNMIAALTHRLAPFRQPLATSPDLATVTIHQADITKVPVAELGVAHAQLNTPLSVLESEASAAPCSLNVVGNLPYNMTAAILFHVCGEMDALEHPMRQRLRHLTIMIQREVADRLVAVPNTKAFNALSLAIQTWFDPVYCFTVPPQAFHPAPKVTSAVVQLTPRTTPRMAPECLGKVKGLIKLAFHQRRKTLRNSLAGHPQSAILSSWLAETLDAQGVPFANARPEALGHAQWEAMARALL